MRDRSLEDLPRPWLLAALAGVPVAALVGREGAAGGGAPADKGAGETAPAETAGAVPIGLAAERARRAGRRPQLAGGTEQRSGIAADGVLQPAVAVAR